MQKVNGMKVKYLEESDPLQLLNGKIYNVMCIEDDFYRIIDETDEDYLYPPRMFEIIEKGQISETIEVIKIDDRFRLDLSNSLEWNIAVVKKLLRESGNSEEDIEKYINETKSKYFNEDGTRKDGKDKKIMEGN